MDIKDYAQMMSYLTRPRDVVPDPRPMAQGGRIGFSKGADTSPVYNEKTGHIYKIGNRHGQFYSKTPPKNQFTAVKPLRSLEELQLVIDEAPLLEIDGKFFEQNPKDLAGDSEYSTKELISRKELDKKGPDGVKNRDKLKFKSTGKKRIEETNQGNITRRNKIIATQGSEIPIIGGKKINRAFSHVYPIIESAKPGTKTTTVIDADMNSKLIGYNRIGQKIAEDQEYLLKVKPEGYKKQILVNNAKAKKNVMNAIQDLGKDYKGQIGYFQVDPETESFKPKAGNYKMSFAGVEGKDEIYKDMTGKKRQDFSKKISAIENKKNTGMKLSSNPFFDPSLMGKVISDIGKGINVGLGPTGILALNTALGVDPTSSMDRAGLGLEAALAKPLVKGATSVTDQVKNPMLRKIAERAALTGMSPAMAMKVARVASPLGIASLGLEGLYQVGKLGYEDQKRFDALSPEEKAAERAKQEAFAFDVTGA